jgi:hypothetical protein
VRAGLADQPVAARMIGGDVATWRTARAAACAEAPTMRSPRLACLDGVLARIDAVAHAAKLAGNAGQVDAGALLIDPRVCEAPRAPRLMTNTSPEFRDVLATWLGRTVARVPLRDAQVAAMLGRTTTDPCASSLVHLVSAEIQQAGAEHTRQLDEAQQDAERCGDDRVLSETALDSARYALENEWLSATMTTKLRLADAAIQRVAQPDLKAMVDAMRAEIAKRNEHLDDAIKYAGEAMDGFAARGRLREQIRAGFTVLDLRQGRATAEDLAAVPTSLAAWRARAVAELGPGDDIVRQLDAHAAMWAWLHGDVAHADAELERVRSSVPNDRSQRIAGVVVDSHGVPVAGATVTAGAWLRGDSLHAAFGMTSRDAMRIAKTGADGRFELTDAAENAIVIAELGDQRALPVVAAAEVKLQLGPVSRLEGRVELAGHAAPNVLIVVRAAELPVPWAYGILAPVAADGSFSIDGVPRREVRVFAVIEGPSEQMLAGTTIRVTQPVVRGISLSLVKSRRIVHVLVRNTVNAKLANSEVIVLPGKIPSMSAKMINQELRGGTMRNARQIEGEHVPKEIAEIARPGDLYATVPNVPEGVASVCAIALPEMDTELGRKMQAHLDKIQVTCTPIPEHASVVTVEVPPFPRLD